MAENHHLARLRPPALTAFLILAVIVAGFYWKLVLSDQYTWLAGDDTSRQVMPWFQFQAGEWHQGRFPLWDPSHWAGQPLPGQVITSAMYPPNWILYSLPLHQGWIRQVWLHGYFVLTHIVAAWFAYLLARTAGATRAGAIFGGVVFTLSGWMGQTEWPQMLGSAMWAPLTALFLFKWMASPHWRQAAFAGFFLGVAWLGGHHQIPIFVSVACLVFWVWALWRNWRVWPAFLLFWTLAASTGAAQALPAYEYGRLAIRWAGAPEPSGWSDRLPYTVHGTWSMSPAGLLGFLLPYAHTHASPFLGFVSLGLATLGVVWNWSRPAVRVLVLLFLLGCCLALVQHTPVHGLFYALVPLVEKARNPSSALFLCGLAAAPLAALGLSGLALHRDSAWTRRVMLTGLSLAGLLFATRVGMILFQAFPGMAEHRELIVGLAGFAAAISLAAFRARQIGPNALHACLVGLALMEFGAHAGVYFPNVKSEPERIANLTALRAHDDIAQWLHDQPGLFRIDVDESIIPYNFGGWHGLQQSGGYLASITERNYRQGFHEPRIKNLLGVAYRVAATPDPQFPELVFTSASGLHVWRNPAAMPRVFAERAASPPTPCAPADTVQPVLYRPGLIRVAAQLSCPGTVVFTETNYPGWQVTVDGRPAELLEAHGFLQGVAVGAGAHWVEFAYRPASVYWGAAISLASLLAVLTFCFYG